LVLSNPAANQLAVFDVRGAAKPHFALIKLDKPGGLAFEPDGKLLAATNGEIKRFTVQNNWKSCTLSGGQTVVGSADLQEPKQIIENNGEIYVSDWGKSHQVKVFDAASGKLSRVIGKAGGPQIGDYDEERMAHPLGISVDSNGVLWVAENDYLPKRISRWEAKSGKFINAWYGPTQYGGGGFADPKDLSRAYYPSIGNPGSFGLLEFKVDLQSGGSKLTAVRYRYPDPKDNMISYYGYDHAPIFFPNDMAPMGSHGGTAPGQTFYYQGHQYFTNAYNSYWYNQGSETVLWILENGVCRPIASCGWVWSGAHRWPKLDDPDIKKNIPTDGKADEVFYVWTDLNHDHAVQADEVQFFRPAMHAFTGVVFQPDLSIVSSTPFQIPAATVDDKGVPGYDFSKLRLLAGTEAPVGGDVALSPDGWTIIDCKGYKDGQLRWTLATRADKTPPKGPGDLEDPKRMLGYPVKAANGEAGWLVARYSYMGEIYVYSSDGILVTTLGADARVAPFWPYAKQEKGMAITGLTFDAEHFWPFMFGNDDGNVYLCVGKWHSSIVKLDGLDKVKRIDLGQCVVSAQVLAELATARESKAASDALREQVPVSSLASVKVDGKLNEWPPDKWAPINEQCSFQLAVSGNRLVVAYRTDQPDLLQNSAAEFPFAFTQGGGLDLMLRGSGSGASREPGIGDVRLFVTRKDGKTLAVLYRQKTANGGNKQVFASPVGQVAFDDVQGVSQSVQVVQDGGNYEFSVPLALLGLQDPAGKYFRGDAGLVLGNGSKARARIYWHNKEDSMCADVPSEARLNPGQWGLFKF